MLKLMAGFDMKSIPYKGTGPTLIAVMSNEVIAMFGGAINTVPHVKAGRLRALAVAGDRRAQALPDVPTVAEAGYPGYEANSWNGIVAPAGTPRAIIDKLNTTIVKVLQLPEVRNFMINDGAEPAYNTPDQFAAFLRTDYAKWAKVIKASGLKDSQ
jgi:tripartite-type tricarboxylate transporter receptor subunit TctC